MELDKALMAGNLAKKIKKLEQAIITLGKGYPDEWEVRNEHNSHKVELNSEHLETLVDMFKKEKEEAEKELSKL